LLIGICGGVENRRGRGATGDCLLGREAEGERGSVSGRLGACGGGKEDLPRGRVLVETKTKMGCIM
jgi:hypothetical protein